MIRRTCDASGQALAIFKLTPLFFVLLQCPTEFDEADRVTTVWIKTVQAYAGASHECAGGTKDTVYANDDGGIMVTCRHSLLKTSLQASKIDSGPARCKHQAAHPKLLNCPVKAVLVLTVCTFQTKQRKNTISLSVCSSVESACVTQESASSSESGIASNSFRFREQPSSFPWYR